MWLQVSKSLKCLILMKTTFNVVLVAVRGVENMWHDIIIDDFFISVKLYTKLL
jgi:hypothetical protein